VFFKCIWIDTGDGSQAPRSQIGMMRSAVFSGNGDQFHKEKNGFVEMVDVQDEGVEGTITGKREKNSILVWLGLVYGA
jgi:hypothetical protein